MVYERPHGAPDKKRRRLRSAQVVHVPPVLAVDANRYASGCGRALAFQRGEVARVDDIRAQRLEQLPKPDMDRQAISRGLVKREDFDVRADDAIAESSVIGQADDGVAEIRLRQIVNQVHNPVLQAAHIQTVDDVRDQGPFPLGDGVGGWSIAGALPSGCNSQRLVDCRMQVMQKPACRRCSRVRWIVGILTVGYDHGRVVPKASELGAGLSELGVDDLHRASPPTQYHCQTSKFCDGRVKLLLDHRKGLCAVRNDEYALSRRCPGLAVVG